VRDPWEKLDNEVNIPIVKDFNYKWTRRWFVLRNQTTFSTFLPPRFAHDRPWKGIQIGVFEGMDLVWCFQNIYRHADSRVLAVDPWVATTKLDQEYMSGVEQRARHNLTKWRNQLTIVKDYSQDYLQSLPDYEFGTYDLIIIDGDHNADAVYHDAIISYELAKPGGVLLFDDVRNRIPKKDHVEKGLSCFLEDYKGHVERVWQHRFMDCVIKL